MAPGNVAQPAQVSFLGVPIHLGALSLVTLTLQNSALTIVLHYVRFQSHAESKRQLTPALPLHFVSIRPIRPAQCPVSHQCATGQDVQRSISSVCQRMLERVHLHVYRIVQHAQKSISQHRIRTGFRARRRWREQGCYRKLIAVGTRCQHGANADRS